MYHKRLTMEMSMSFNEAEAMDRIAGSLASLGVKPGDTILVHSSLKSLGALPGGAETLLCAILKLLGREGTLLMPGLSFSQTPHHIHNSNETPCCIGAVPEFFRRRQGTKRSLHPTHSMCGTGPATSSLFDSHSLDSTPCGPNSPFIKITGRPAKIIMLGCGLKPNTTMHAIEELVRPPYLFGGECDYQITDSDGHTFIKRYLRHGFQGWEQRYERVELLPDTSFLRKGRVLDAETFALDAQGLRAEVLKKLNEDPLFFVSKTNLH